MLVQKTLTRNPKFDLLADLAELATGLFLALFLWTHMLFVSTIIFGTRLFNLVPAILDPYYISHVGIAFVILAILLHIVVAGRRVPLKVQEQRIIWQHMRKINHKDSWIWLVQIGTGAAIGILASIHIWAVLSDWPIEAAKSAVRIKGPYFWLYVLLLLVGEFHASIGVYRQCLKWGFFQREKASRALSKITVIMLALGIIALLVFYFIIKVNGGGA